ncbi:MAG: ABC transporter ATP-binding protein, partial [Flavobacteriaceae bacterium]
YVGPALMYSINTIALFVIVISYMLSIAPSLTLYTILPLPILSVTIYKISRVINIRSTAVQELLSKMSTVAQENFSGISVIKSYGLETYTQNQFKEQAEQSYQKNMALVKVQAWFFPLMILLIGMSNLIVIFVGGMQYMNGTIAFGVLAEFIIYVNMLTWPVTVVGWVTSIVQQAEASQKRINAFLEEKPQVNSGKIDKKTIAGQLRFEGVSFQYPETGIKALNQISFELEPGEKLGILGKIGSGKSSLLELVPRLYDPTEGEIFLDNINLKEYNLDCLRNAIAYVPQNPFLFSESIEDNIRFGKQNAVLEEIKKVAHYADIAENIDRFSKGYKTLLGERGLTLSGGQIQRVSIARALLKEAQILLLDDCLSAVDTETEETILKNLESIAAQKTTLIVSHRISSVKHANQIIVLENGKIIQQGNHINLVSKQGYYKDLYEKQQSEKTN